VAREIGDVLEYYIRSKYGFKKTQNSGAVKGDGDMYSRLFRGEAKNTEKKSTSIKLDIWNKIVKEAGKNGQMPIMFHGFTDKGTKSVMAALVTTDVSIFDYIIHPNKLLLEHISDEVADLLESKGFTQHVIKEIKDEIIKFKIDI